MSAWPVFVRSDTRSWPAEFRFFRCRLLSIWIETQTDLAPALLYKGRILLLSRNILGEINGQEGSRDRVGHHAAAGGAWNERTGGEPATLVRRHHLAQPDPDGAVLESDPAPRLREERRVASPESRAHRSRAHRDGPARRAALPLFQSQLHRGERGERIPGVRAPQGRRAERRARGPEGFADRD